MAAISQLVVQLYTASNGTETHLQQNIHARDIAVVTAASHRTCSSIASAIVSKRRLDAKSHIMRSSTRP